MDYQLIKKDSKTKARRGVLTTAHGKIQTPFFMPVGTNGSVKTLTFEEVLGVGAEIVLSNTYHLYLRPGTAIIEKAGGLHRFMSWEGPILTDSGGYQVFSLSKLRKIKNDGVEFRSHLDGSLHLFTPEKVLEIQYILGSDIMMPLDECAPYPCSRKEAAQSVERTKQWAIRSKDFFRDNPSGKDQALFGIVQGAIYEDLRKLSARQILDIGFDGYAIGGVSVGEPVGDMFAALQWVVPMLPENQPRYFMGIGLPDQIVKAVGEGIDMFDTCLPTRYGRHGTAFTKRGRIILRNAEFADDFTPIDESCDCAVCQKYTRSYIRHLANMNEITGLKLVTYHNVHFYIRLMGQIREAIENDSYAEFQKGFLNDYRSALVLS